MSVSSSSKRKGKLAKCGDSTAVLHVGSTVRKPMHSLVDPIFPTATFTFENTKDLVAFKELEVKGDTGDRIEYGRYGNPTVSACERKLAALDHGEDALLFPSGMAAITSTLLALLSAGDHLIIGDDCYRRTRQFCTVYLERFGITSTIVAMGDYAAVEAAITPKTKVIMLESPTNPYLRVVDLEKLAGIAKKRGVISVIDATFASPINQNALDFGVDIVIHAATKYLGGHNDFLAGAVIGARQTLAPVRQVRGVFGGMVESDLAFKLHRSVKTLALRMHKQNENGQLVAEFLEKQPKISRVWYPGLASHPDHQIAVEQMRAFGGVVSFEIKGDYHDTGRFIDALKIPKIAPSLGGVDSLVEQPAIMSFFEMTSEERGKYGMKDNLVRYALGIEDSEDLIADLEAALAVL